MIISDIPSRWLEVLAAVQKAAPDAVLAGGALRDHWSGAPVKDLDIFVGHDPQDNAQNYTLYKALTAAEPTVSLTQTCNFASCDELGDCYQTDTYRLADGLEVNLIILAQSGLEATVNRIDFGYCQIGTDGVRVYETDHRVTDVFAKTFTLVRGDTDADVDRSLRRWDRLSQKYPGFTLVNPYRPDFA
jgi:hypothetical protein